MGARECVSVRAAELNEGNVRHAASSHSQHEPEVIGVEDRAEGLVLADL